ncbi:PTS transporter subunit EIIA [Citrobacter freundii]|nr:PTS transporter subunit EIIA [Citrobacter freundii]
MLIPHHHLVQARRKATDWQQALDIALRPLYAEGFVTADYYQGVIDNTQVWGPYYIVAPGIALPHARPEQGAKACGIAITTLEEPVCFGHEDCDPVWLLVALCAPDTSTHLATIQRITTLIDDSHLLTQLREAGTDSQLFHLLNAAENRGC